MTATDRLHIEQLFHDWQASRRAATFAEQPDQLLFDDESYLNHETWIRPAMAQLGDVRGLRVLDFGCGHGMAAVVLARRGGQVCGFDLSRGYLQEARRRALANEQAIDFLQADGERLPFEAGSFDRIWGNAVLHHLDLAIVAKELHRVLRPQGIAVFCEPWGENPLLALARRRLPYPGKARTPDERPWTRRHLRRLQQVFSHVEVHGYQLLTMVRRILPAAAVTAYLQAGDDWLLRRLPNLKYFCRYVVVVLRRG